MVLVVVACSSTSLSWLIARAMSHHYNKFQVHCASLCSSSLRLPVLHRPSHYTPTHWLVALLDGFFCSLLHADQHSPAPNATPVLTPGIGILWTLLVMAFPWHPDGLVRALSFLGYAVCCAPFVWVAFLKITSHLQVLIEKEVLFPRLGDYSGITSGFSKLY
ncbi:hypothetical protein F2Q68_00027994 [Brassica cretica]|uniref:Uncharacterized protein n=1 Tax=Brassica cretica TaxID=69181 RepID=A0A8S9I8Q5_BRACR|nr:hypothetical protein F2Q68_00027994 [Brassica cretica]